MALLTRSGAKPVVFVIDASIDVTGALVSARREAELLQDVADFVLVLPRHSRAPQAALAPFAEVLHLPMPQIRRHLPSLLTYGPALIATSARLLREIRRRECSRVQINDFYLMHGTMLRALGFHGQIVTWVRIDPRRFGGLGRLWLCAADRSSDAIVSVSRFIQSVLKQSVRSRLIYDSRLPEPARRKSNSDGRQLLYVGNYIPGKGQDLAVAAFERIAPMFPDARLHFVGGDMGLAGNRAYRERMQRQAAHGAAADRIEFADRVDDLSSLYRSSYAALNFSSSESFSLTCLDASAFGLPIIATRSGGPEEIVEDGLTGFLIPVGDVEAAVDRMIRLLTAPKLAAAMGEQGASLIRTRFSTERFRNELLDLFHLR